MTTLLKDFDGVNFNDANFTTFLSDFIKKKLNLKMSDISQDFCTSVLY